MTGVKAATVWLRLVALFFLELAKSVKDVVATVLHPRRPIRSAIVAFPLDLKSNAGITLLANMVSLTPGTTSIHISEDQSRLYIHVMNVSDESVSQIKDGFENVVKEVLS